MIFKTADVSLGLNSEASRWISRLRLRKHPEGGYFRRTFLSSTSLDLPGYVGSRRACSAIYYMLVDDQVSAFHRIRSDEVWHHYAGGSLTVYVGGDGVLSKIHLGKRRGERPQAVVEKNTWFAASLRSGSYCLAGCTVAPGFDYQDWELGTRSQLFALYPRHKKIIERLTIV